MTWLRRLLQWPRRRQETAALAEEIEHHRALVQADLESRGMSADAAAIESRRLMGNITLAAEEARDVWIVTWIDRLWRDVKYALRRLRFEPTFALTAAVTLALGVTTTTTVFSVADAELWKPLPFPHPEQLVLLTSRGPADRASNDAISGVDLVDWRANLRAFSDIAMSGRTMRQVMQRQTAESVVVTEVTANYFSTLGRPARSGRVFTGAEARGTRAAVLTDRAWRRLFGADPLVVGRAIVLDDVPTQVLGIVAADDSLGGDPDLFVVLDESAAPFLDRAQPLGYGAIARLHPGMSQAEGLAEFQTVAAQLARTTHPDRAGRRFSVQDLSAFSSGYNWRPLYFFLGASIVVLLLSAVNVATLVLSRATGRVREFALRSALGGGRAALARQLLVEGAAIALPAGAAGVLLASWTVRLFTSALPGDFLARGSNIPVDLRVCAFAIAATCCVTLVCALVPLPIAQRIDAATSLRSGTRVGRSQAEGRARSALLAVQLALTVMLMCGAAIFLKSFLSLRQVPLGFDPANLVSLRVSLSGARYRSDAAIRTYGEQLIERARGVAGARDAAIGSSSPLASGPLVFFARADRPRPAREDAPDAILRAATPGYFRTLGTPIVRGREFTHDDGPGAEPVVIINETLAAAVFGTGDPVGRILELLPGSRAPWTRHPGPRRIVGVASNVKEVGMNEVAFSDAYVPFAQMPAPALELIVRAAGAPARLPEALRASAALVDPGVPVRSVSTFDERVTEALRGDRFNLLLVSWFAMAALVVAATGVYGAIAQHVASRTREFGVRLALGARPARLVGATIWRTGRLALAGSAIGLAGVLVLARVLGNALYLVPGSHNGLLYDVTLTDPAMLVAASAGMLVVALGSAAVPARQVTRVDPVRALRSE